MPAPTPPLDIITKQGVLDFLATRRSPKLRALTGPAPRGHDLDRMLTIAARVPDHGKIVPWRFLIIQDQRRHDLDRAIGDRFDQRFPDASQERRAEARQRMTHAPLVIAVIASPVEHPKIPEWEQFLSTGAVCMNLLHAAKALGYAGLWLTEWYATDPVILRTLRIAPHERIAGFFHIGTEQSARTDRERPSLERIVRRY